MWPVYTWSHGSRRLRDYLEGIMEPHIAISCCANLRMNLGEDFGINILHNGSSRLATLAIDLQLISSRQSIRRLFPPL